LNAVRNLRAGLVDLAFALQDQSDHRALLVLSAPRISEKRLRHEWELVARTFRPEVTERLGLVVFQNGQMRGYPREPAASIRERLEGVIRSESARGGEPLPRADHAYEIFKILVHQWMMDAGPMAVGNLEKTAGCAYPTVAKALERYSTEVNRNTNRSVELIAFPKVAWAAFLARGDEVRPTFRFADRSGQPRSPEAMISRLGKLHRGDVAVGGAVGARGHYPDLDLLGTPRVDLTMHCPGGRMDLGFVSRLDPALKPSVSREEPPALVIHVLRRKESYFSPATDGLRWADPVECLLDLHEARLEPQAKEFLTHFAGRRRKP
jgi:hypothetical protein